MVRGEPASPTTCRGPWGQVLVLSKYDFYHCVDKRTQELMSVYAKKFYFDEDSIRKSILKQHRWLGSPRQPGMSRPQTAKLPGISPGSTHFPRLLSLSSTS